MSAVCSAYKRQATFHGRSPNCGHRGKISFEGNVRFASEFRKQVALRIYICSSNIPLELHLSRRLRGAKKLAIVANEMFSKTPGQKCKRRNIDTSRSGKPVFFASLELALLRSVGASNDYRVADGEGSRCLPFACCCRSVVSCDA